MRFYWNALGILLLVASLPVASSADPIVGSTAQSCRGPATFLSPKQTLPLTCNVTSPLGGAKMLVLPEMWVPGNGCIVTTDKPRVVMVGNNFGVSATLTNRCGSSYKASEGGLAWIIF
ncbi:MAG: hypothetical protein ACREJ4_07085 [Candidatus Methylomirabilaceae bacterium]